MRTHQQERNRPIQRSPSSTLRRSPATSAAPADYAGNSATEGYLRTMTVSDPGDRAEVNAQQTADAVMGGLGGGIHRSSGAEGGFEAPAEVVSGIESASHGPADSLPAGLSGQMGSAMGQSFAGVRVHDNPAAHDMSAKIDAGAFTVGSDIFFGAGQYQPDTPSGQHLIAHELTHVAQDGGDIARSVIHRETDEEKRKRLAAATSPASAPAPLSPMPTTPPPVPPVASTTTPATPATTPATPTTTPATPATTPATPVAPTAIAEADLNDKAKGLVARLKNPLVRRMVLIFLRLQKHNDGGWENLILQGAGKIGNALDTASAGLGLVGSTADAVGVGADSAAYHNEEKKGGAGREAYVPGATDIVSGGANILGSGISGVKTIVDEVSANRGDTAARKKLEAQGMTISKDDYEGSGDLAGTLLKSVGSGFSMAGGAFGIAGGVTGLGATGMGRRSAGLLKDDENSKEGKDLKTASDAAAGTAGALGLAGGILGNIGSSLGLLADVKGLIGNGMEKTNETLGKAKAALTLSFGALKDTEAGTAAIELKPGMLLENRVKYIKRITDGKKSEGEQMQLLTKYFKEGKPATADPEVQKINSAAGKYMMALNVAHAQHKSTASSIFDTALSSVDFAGGLMGTIGGALTSFMGNSMGGMITGLVLRGLSSVVGMATNAISTARSGKKLGHEAVVGRNKKYAGRVDGIISAITNLPDLLAGGFTRDDITNFGTSAMSAEGKKQVDKAAASSPSLDALGDYVDMVDNLQGKVNLLHFAAAISKPDEEAVINPDEKSALATVIGKGIGR